MSAEQAARMKDREEWARQQEEEYQARMAEIKEHNRILREQMTFRMRESKENAAKIERMIIELCDLDPVWESRRRAVQEVCYPSHLI